MPSDDHFRTFPIGVVLAGPVDLRVPGSGIVSAHASYNSGWTRWRHSPDLGLRENGLQFAMLTGAEIGVGTNTSEFKAGTDPILPALETDLRRGPIKLIQGVYAEPASDTFFAIGSPTTEDAETAAQAILDLEGEYTSIWAWHVADDVTDAHEGVHAPMLADALQRLDPLGRPAVYVHTDLDASVWANDDNLRIGLAYRYPCGVYANGNASVEGDFHRSTFSGVADKGAGGGDWVDAIRDWTEHLPSGAICWWFVQCHGNIALGATGVSTTAVRLPTVRELRTQFWILVGEGMKGIFFFEGTSSSGLSDGIFDPDKESYREVAASLSSRLTPSIRRDLMASSRIANAFTATGGGLSGIYSNAYISTLQNRNGERYVVVVNRDTSSAAITIASASLTGHLVNMETGERIGIGASVTLDALDGTIFRHDPILGVPRWDPDEGADVETFWAGHWANPDSSLWVGTVETHPNEIAVTPATIQDAINAATVPTTFLCEAGTYGFFEVIGKSNLHFVAADPDDRPTFHSVNVFGHAYAEHYHGPTTGVSWRSYVGMLALYDDDYVEAFLNPARDIIFRSIDWVGEHTTNPVQYGWEQGSNGVWYNNTYLNSPLFMRTIRDVLIEDCTFDNYYMAHDTNDGANTDPRSAPNTTEAPSGHPGLINGGSSNRNIVTRGCTLSGAPTSGFGFPNAWYFDGGVGNIAVGNTLLEKWHGQQFLILCNDDHTRDQNQDGRFLKNVELFNGRYNCFVGNTCTGAPISVTMTGGYNLVAENTYTGTLGTLAKIEGRVTSNAYTFGVFYECYGNVIRDNEGVSIATRGVEVATNACFSAPLSSSTHRYRCRIGKTTVTNNVFSGTVPDWYEETGTASPGYADGPDVISGNTP